MSRSIEHPSSLALEALACGETTPEVETHLTECGRCRELVDMLRRAALRGPSMKLPDLEALASGVPEEPATKLERPWFARASRVVLPLALAAGLLLYLRRPPPDTPDASTNTSTSSGAPVVSASRPEGPEPETTFKGAAQVAVIRDRSGIQERFVGEVRVRPGDRLRVEVALDREQSILAAVLGDDASWLELMPPGPRPAGTHFSERATRIEAPALRGRILVGAPEAVARARETARFSDVGVVRVEWEEP